MVCFLIAGLLFIAGLIFRVDLSMGSQFIGCIVMAVTEIKTIKFLEAYNARKH